VLVALLISTAYLPVNAQDSGTFKSEFVVAPETIGTNQSTPSILVSSSGVIYLAWDEEIGGFSEIFVTRSTDQGKNFETPIQLTDSSGQTNQSNPDLGLDSTGILLVAWEDRTDGDSDIYIAKSQSTWGSFETAVEASDGPVASDQIHPSIVVDSLDSVHIAWEDLRADNDIRASSSSVSTLSFGTSVKVNDDTGTSWQHEPSIAADGSDLYVAWYDRRDVDPFIYIAKSSNGGATYGSNIRIESDMANGPQFEPAITVNGGRIYVVWQDGRSGVSRDIYLASSSTSALSFGDGVRVNSGTASTNQRSPALALADNGTIHVVWQDFRDQVNDLYYATSTDGGTSFVDERVNEAPGDVILEKRKPEVAVSTEGILYAVWEDQQSEDSRIVMATSEAVDNGDGNGEDDDTASTNTLTWIFILIIIVLVLVVVIAMLLRRRGGKKEE
jgi:hypothetical protein